MKKKLVIIGANDFQAQLILKARAKGYETHAFAWQCGDVGERAADFFYPISIVEKEKILEVCREIRPDGVASVASDLASITVNYLAEQMGLTGNGMVSAMLSTNKHQMRQAFEAHGVPSPRSLQLAEGEEPDLSGFTYPLIVKPTDRSGSRGIFKIEEPGQLKDAVERARKESFEKRVLVEEFAEGEEFSIEYVSWKGEHHFLAITKKYTTEAPKFIEMGHMEPADVSEESVRKIQELVPRALDVLGIRYGFSHTELKIDGEGCIRFIEIGGRMGGDCIGADLVALSTGWDSLGMAVDIACGKAPSFEKIREPGYALVRFIFSPQDLENLKWVKAHYPEAIFRVSEIQPMDGRSIEGQRRALRVFSDGDKDQGGHGSDQGEGQWLE